MKLTACLTPPPVFRYLPCICRRELVVLRIRDTGWRPFLLPKGCSPANLGIRYRRNGFPTYRSALQACRRAYDWHDYEIPLIRVPGG